MLKIIQSLFWYIKLFNNAPYAVINYYRIAKNARIIYSIITNIFLLTCEGVFMLEYVPIEDSVDLKLIILKFLQSFLSCSCFIANIIVGFDWNNQIPLALNYLQTYDNAAKFPKKNHHFKLNYFRVVIIVVLLHLIFIVYLRHQVTCSFFDSFLYCIYIEFYLQILNFCGLMLSIHHRFHHLDHLILGRGNINLCF